MEPERQSRLSSSDSVLGRLTRKIVDDMGAAIVTGDYAPHELLPIESQLGAKYGASRSVLRESIKVLNAKGLLTARPRRGTSVTPPSQWNLFDPDVLRWTLKRNLSLPLLIEFTHVRLGIEPLAASLAATNGSDEALTSIHEGYERMAAANKGEDDPLEADIAFHLAILNASGNRFFMGLKPLVEAALNFSIRYTDSIARDEASKLSQHRDVLDAILTHDAPRAHATAEQLLRDAKALMEKGLTNSTGA